MDSGDFGTKGIVYSFGEFVPSLPFTIDPKSGKITVNDSAKLDWETKKEYHLTVTATFYRDLCTDVLVNDFLPTLRHNTILPIYISLPIIQAIVSYMVSLTKRALAYILKSINF